MPDHLIGHRRLVHDRVDLAHVEVGSGAADLIEIVPDADVDHEGAGLDQMARRNELADPDLVGDIGEHLAQALAVAAIGRCGDTEDANHRIALQRPVDDSPITFGHRMVCFVDHQEIERRHGFEIGSARQGRHHREGDLALPRLLGGIDHRGGQRRINPGELAAVLFGELVAVGQHTGLGAAIADHLTGDGRQHDGLSSTGRRDSKRVAVGVERSNAALDEQFLTRTEHHGQALTSPRWDGCRRPEPLTAMRDGLQPGSSALAVTRETPLPAVASWPARRSMPISAA